MRHINIITGSTLGGAEYVGDCLAEELKKNNITSDIFYEPNLNEIPCEGIWLIICSTHGAGDYPETIEPFAKQLQEQNPNLSNILFSIIAIGDSSYDTFCGAGKKLETLLQKLKAQSLIPRFDIDVSLNPMPEEATKDWTTVFIEALKQC